MLVLLAVLGNGYTTTNGYFWSHVPGWPGGNPVQVTGDERVNPEPCYR